MAVLGVDFGTSNSAAGVTRDGAPHLICLEGEEQTLPTAVFFDFDAKEMKIGSAAGAALLAGDEGRYMRALKSLLGAPLMREKRNLLGEKLDFIDIVSRFLERVRQSCERETGARFTHALSGRPVRFHPDPERNAQAEVDLREAYQRAGFTDVAFMYEPEAAALANRSLLSPGDLGLIVDIGGGTSDFTVFRNHETKIEILASYGVRLGGTDFDRCLSLETVMPLLGRGGQIRHAFGDETHTAPTTIFNDLATWQKIPFLYAPDSRRLAKDLAQHAVEPALFERLVSVLADELGHDIAFAVETGKIAVNTSGAGQINLGVIESGLEVPLDAGLVQRLLSPMTQDMAQAALNTMTQAQVAPEAVTHLIFVGGSSLMQVTRDALEGVFPSAQVHHGSALTAIVDGLSLASADAFK